MMTRFCYHLIFPVISLFMIAYNAQASKDGTADADDFDDSLAQTAQICAHVLAEDLKDSVGESDAIPCRLARSRYDGFEAVFQESARLFLDDKRMTQRLIFEYLRVVDRMLSDFPPSEFIYVALGASPTIIFAILEDLDPEIVTIDLPLSIREESRDLVLTSQLRAYLRRAFSSTLRDPRRYVLLDYAFSGKSLERATNLIRTYLRERGAHKAVEPLALRKRDNLIAPSYSCNHIVMPRNVAIHIHEEDCKKYRKYPRKTIASLDGPRLRESINLEYANLKKFLMMLRDAPRAKL